MPAARPPNLAEAQGDVNQQEHRRDGKAHQALLEEPGAMLASTELEESSSKPKVRIGALQGACNGGLLLRDLRTPDFRDYAVDVPQPGAVEAQDTQVLGGYVRDLIKRNLSPGTSGSLVPTSPPPTSSPPCSRPPDGAGPTSPRRK